MTKSDGRITELGSPLGALQQVAAHELAATDKMLKDCFDRSLDALDDLMDRMGVPPAHALPEYNRSTN